MAGLVGAELVGAELGGDVGDAAVLSVVGVGSDGPATLSPLQADMATEQTTERIAVSVRPIASSSRGVQGPKLGDRRLVGLPLQPNLWTTCYLCGRCGNQDGDRIVLAGTTGDVHLRWTFNDITLDGFVWRGEKSTDGGKTFRLAEELRLRRAV